MINIPLAFWTSGVTGFAFLYLRPDAVSIYLRPDGVSLYFRP